MIVREIAMASVPSGTGTIIIKTIDLNEFAFELPGYHDTTYVLELASDDYDEIILNEPKALADIIATRIYHIEMQRPGALIDLAVKKKMKECIRSALA